jgi:hypothetical protein
MSGQANITVFDGASTPVTHTLVPTGVSSVSGKTTAGWREAALSLPLIAQIRFSTEGEERNNGTIVLSAISVVPVMESIGSQNAAGYTAAPKVAYEIMYKTTSYSISRASISDRRLARQLHVNLLGNVSTSVAAVTSGFCPELFDQVIMPS